MNGAGLAQLIGKSADNTGLRSVTISTAATNMYPPPRSVFISRGRFGSSLSLRRKLGDDPKQPRLIRTVRGGGYLFTAPVEAVRERLLVNK